MASKFPSIWYVIDVISEAIGVNYDNTSYTQNRAGGMSSQLVEPNLTLRTMQLNAWVADNFMNIKILFLPPIL